MVIINILVWTSKPFLKMHLPDIIWHSFHDWMFSSFTSAMMHINVCLLFKTSVTCCKHTLFGGSNLQLHTHCGYEVNTECVTNIGAFLIWNDCFQNDFTWNTFLLQWNTVIVSTAFFFTECWWFFLAGIPTVNIRAVRSGEQGGQDISQNWKLVCCRIRLQSTPILILGMQASSPVLLKSQIFMPW